MDSLDPILGLRLNNPNNPLNLAWEGDHEFNWQQIANLFLPPIAWHAPGCYLFGDTDATWTQSSLAWVTRKGAEVWVAGTLGVTARSGGAGYVNMALPYTAVPIGQLYPKIDCFQIGGLTPSVAGCGSLVWEPIPGTKQARLVSSNFSSSANEPVSNINAGFSFRFQGMYWTNDPLP
jgi:hypothetical protein